MRASIISKIPRQGKAPSWQHLMHGQNIHCLCMVFTGELGILDFPQLGTQSEFQVQIQGFGRMDRGANKLILLQ